MVKTVFRAVGLWRSCCYFLLLATLVRATDDLFEGSGEGSGEEPLSSTLGSVESPTSDKLEPPTSDPVELPQASISTKPLASGEAKPPSSIPPTSDSAELPSTGPAEVPTEAESPTTGPAEPPTSGPAEPPTIQQFSLIAPTASNTKPKPVAPLSPKVCNPKMDLIFLLDTSGSIEQIYDDHVKWTVNLVDALPVNREQVRIAAVQYAGFPLTEFALGTYFNAADLRQHLEQMKFQSGVTRTGYALRKADSELFREERGARPGAKKVIVLFTDGLSIDDPMKPATHLREKKGVKIYVVSVGSDGFEPEMNRIAGDKNNVFGPNELARLRDALLRDAQESGSCAKSGSIRPAGRSTTSLTKTATTRTTKPVLSSPPSIKPKAQSDITASQFGQKRTTSNGANVQNIEADQASLKVPKTTSISSSGATSDQILASTTRLSSSNKSGEKSTPTIPATNTASQKTSAKNSDNLSSEKEVSSESKASFGSVEEAFETPNTGGIKKNGSKSSEISSEFSIFGSEVLGQNETYVEDIGTPSITTLEQVLGGSSKSASAESDKSASSETLDDFDQNLSSESKSDSLSGLSNDLGAEKDSSIEKDKQNPLVDSISSAELIGKTKSIGQEDVLEGKAQKSERISASSEHLTNEESKQGSSEQKAQKKLSTPGSGKVPGSEENSISRESRAKHPRERFLSEKATASESSEIDQQLRAQSETNSAEKVEKSTSESASEVPSTKDSKKPVKKPIRHPSGPSASETKVTTNFLSKGSSVAKAPTSSRSNTGRTTLSSVSSTVRSTATRKPVTKPPTFSSRRVGEGVCALDVLFIVDSSGSVQTIYDKQKEYLTSILGELQVGDQRAALLQFSGGSHQKTEWTFDTFADSHALMHAFSQIRHFTGTTFIGRALEASVGLLDSRRKNVPTIVVLVSDGFSQDDATKPAEVIRRLPNVEFYSVSVSDLNNFDYMVQLTDDDSKVFVGERSEDLRQLLLKRLHCRG